MVGGKGSGGGINEFVGSDIFGLHVVIMIFDLDSPGGKTNGQNQLKTDVES